MPRRVGPPPSARCKHELVRTECADCKHPRPTKGSTPRPRLGVGFSREFPASYDGECSQCLGSVYEGDPIRMKDNEPWCEGCVREERL